MIWGRLPQRQDAQKIQQNFSVLTNKKFVPIHVHYRFLLQNGGRGIYFSAAIHYGFITVCKTAAGQPSNQGMKKLFAASKLPRKHRYNNKKAISQKTDGFGRSVIIGLGKIQSYQWLARGKWFLSENSTTMQVLPIVLRQHFLLSRYTGENTPKCYGVSN